MPRRVSLPGAEELFRSTADLQADRHARSPRRPAHREDEEPGRPSGRVRHDEKITIYLSHEELLHLEQARLTLRARHGIGVDRGRLVREAIAMALADLDEQGAEASLVHRLGEQDGLG